MNKKVMTTLLLLAAAPVIFAQPATRNVDTIERRATLKAGPGKTVLLAPQKLGVAIKPGMIEKSGDDDDDETDDGAQGSQSIEDVNAALDQISGGDQPDPAKYDCVKYKVVPKTYQSYGVNGKWMPYHNTKKWYLVKKPGPDYFQHKKRKNSKVDTKCKKRGGKHVSYAKDTGPGGADSCRLYSSSCPSGYTDISGKCSKQVASVTPEPGTNYGDGGAYVKSVSGLWMPYNDPRNFRYVIRRGQRDYYQHKRNKKRKIKTWCKFTATYTVDKFPNGKDACVNAPGTVKQLCPDGYNYREL